MLNSPADVDSLNTLSANLTFCLSRLDGQQAFDVNLGARLNKLHLSELNKVLMSSNTE